MSSLEPMRPADHTVEQRLRSLKSSNPKTVDDALHRRIMQRVRSVENEHVSSWRLTPALGSALAIVGAVIAVVMLTTQPPVETPSAPEVTLAQTAPASTPQRLLASPEAALEAEYEALKSDLEKLGFSL